MWRRRELIGALGTGAAGLALMANRSEAAQGQAPVLEPRHSGHDPRHSQMLKDCDEACGHCEAACNAAFHHCISLASQGKTPHAKMAQMAVRDVLCRSHAMKPARTNAQTTRPPMTHTA